MPEIVLVFRKPYSNAFSIEYLFHNVYSEIRKRENIKRYELSHYSNSIRNIFCNIISVIQFRNKIIHITGDTYYAVLGALFCKRIITIHDLSFLSRTSGIKRKILKLFWVTLPAKFSHKITVVSQTTKDILLKEVNVPEGKVRVIYNFIDPIYRPVVRRFNATTPQILQIGTNFNKNIKNLVKALESIDCVLIIIGHLSPEQKNNLILSKIKYINKHSLSINELFNEYVMADMLVFVSTIEGFGLPILEAQATCLPVLTSNCSSMPEVAGGGALFVDPFDALSIKEGIMEIITNERVRNEIVDAGSANVKRFSKEQVAREYCELYRDL